MIRRKEWTAWGRNFKWERRIGEPMGRFGGGWEWKLGVQVGGSTVILNLLVGTLRIDRKRRAP